jgi:molecular chaperone IbpA
MGLHYLTLLLKEENMDATMASKYDHFFVGVDRLMKQMDQLHTQQLSSTKYPPYNIRRVDDENYSIEMAIAGYQQEDLDITLEDGKLTISGTAKEDGDGLLYKGIANRSFTRQFTLADTIEVEGADLSNGMLTVSLRNVIPDHKKPKKIPVETGGKLLQADTQLLTE